MKTIKTRSPTKPEHARHVAIIREALNVEVEKLRESLSGWIEENTHRANDTAISIAMLETACDRVGISAKGGNVSALINWDCRRICRARSGGATSG